MIYITFLSLESKISIYLTQKSYITPLYTKIVNILNKYLDFTNVFLEKLAIILLK